VSVAQTFPRTMLTTLTVFITVLLLLIFSGEALWSFNLVLTIGIISGTYSSVFVAAPLILAFKGKVVPPKPVDKGPDPSEGILARKE
jgi:SecD/SecF fusion protein